MTEQAKSSPPTQEHPYPPPTIVPYPHQAYNGAFPPPGGPGGYLPPFFAYPHPPEGNHPEGAPNGVPPGPYMIGLPPGVVYAYPPPQTQAFGAPPTSQPPPALRPKRKQVKMACTNCASACKRCDENRPCERCLKYAIADTCVDGQRKERKRGIKRGPYRRKSKSEGEGSSYSGAEWPNGQPPTTAAAPPPPPVHAVAQYPPEGYYPIYYPPPPGFMPHPHDGQPGSDGSPPHPNAPMMPYYIPAGAYPPFPYPIYPHAGPPPPGAQPAPVPQQSPPQSTSAAVQQPEAQPQTINPADTARKLDTATSTTNGAEVATGGKKRSRTNKSGESKSKRAKRAEKEKEEEANGTNGIDPAVANGDDHDSSA